MIENQNENLNSGLSRIAQYLDFKNIAFTYADKLMGSGNGRLGKMIKNNTVPKPNFYEKFLQTFPDINKVWLDTGEGKMLKAEVTHIDAEPLHLALDPHDDTGEKFQDLGDGTIAFKVPVIPIKAYAGYLVGYQDPEFYEGFDTEVIYVQKQHRGNYLIFVVTGDSMLTTDPALFEYMALPGWKAVSREIPRQHWKFKLHTHKTDTWIIVHKTDGILIKNIIKHEVEGGTITVHSLNPAYQDKEYHLNDVAQIFAVYKYIIDK